MTGRSVRLVAGLAATSTTGEPLVTQAGDFIVTQGGDLLITQSSAGVLSVHEVSVALSVHTKTVALLAGLAATSNTQQGLAVQDGSLLLTQAGDVIVLQQTAAADGDSILEPTVALTGS